LQYANNKYQLMRKILLVALAFAFVSKAQAQETNNAITTATPFLLITPDARAGGMADIGVATSSDAFSMHHNASKMAFNENQISIGVNYTPWLRNLVDDIFIGGVSYVNRHSENAAWAVDFKYFSLGKIDLTDINGQAVGTVNPNELALTGAYSLKLSEHFSMGVSLKYLHSNFKIPPVDSGLEPVNSFGVDVSGYYRSTEENYGDFNGRYRVGFNIANIGPKVSYAPGSEDFIPTNLKLGGGFDFILDDFNTIGLHVEFTKLLVPTPQPDNSHLDEGWISGLFSSFGDAPGGSSEELHEITYAIGAEYLYGEAFALRAGYFNEHEFKGNRKYFTMGAGFQARAFSLDLSYLMNASDVNHPLENTLRFSLAFDLGEIYDDY